MKVFFNAVCRHNVIIVLSLGLFALLASITSFTSAVAMTLAFALNLILSGFIIGLLSPLIRGEKQWMMQLIILATVSTAISMVMVALMPTWVAGIAMYLPLLALTGITLTKVDHQGQFKADNCIFDALGTIVGFAFIALPLSAISELLGKGYIRLVDIVNPEQFYFNWIVIPEANHDVLFGIFQGPYGYIGSLILLSLCVATIQTIRGWRKA
jgi:Na+-translocating ferredoxin:NAD+ oxidoreductase RnfE subunit